MSIRGRLAPYELTRIRPGRQRAEVFPRLCFGSLRRCTGIAI